MPHDKLDTVADKLVRDEHALFGIGRIVARLEFDLLPLNAACLVNVLDRLFDALGQLRAEGRVGPGNRSCYANLDLRPRCAGEPKRQHDGN